MAGKNRNVLKRFTAMKLKGKEIHKRTQPSQKASVMYNMAFSKSEAGACRHETTPGMH